MRTSRFGGEVDPLIVMDAMEAGRVLPELRARIVQPCDWCEGRARRLVVAEAMPAPRSQAASVAC